MELANTAVNPSSRATATGSSGSELPAAAPGAQWRDRDPGAGGGEPLGVAPEHPGVGEQMVAERHRLRLLEVRVCGDDGLGVRSAWSARDATRRSDARRPVPDRVHQVEPEIESHLVVARPSGVQHAAVVTDDVDEPALHGAVHVLVAFEEAELPSARPRRRSPPAPLAGARSRPAQDPLLAQHGDVGLRTADVVGEQAPIDRVHRVTPQLVARRSSENPPPHNAVGRSVIRPTMGFPTPDRLAGSSRIDGGAAGDEASGDHSPPPTRCSAKVRSRSDWRRMNPVASPWS